MTQHRDAEMRAGRQRHAVGEEGRNDERVKRGLEHPDGRLTEKTRDRVIGDRERQQADDGNADPRHGASDRLKLGGKPLFHAVKFPLGRNAGARPAFRVLLDSLAILPR
jgi:hypothetical protein